MTKIISTVSDMVQPKSEHSAQDYLEHLTKMYGPLLASRDLWKILGYASPAAYRQSRVRGQLPIAEFKIEGRRGKFALTLDVANWLFETKINNIERSEPKTED